MVELVVVRGVPSFGGRYLGWKLVGEWGWGLPCGAEGSTEVVTLGSDEIHRLPCNFIADRQAVDEVA